MAGVARIDEALLDVYLPFGEYLYKLAFEKRCSKIALITSYVLQANIKIDDI